MNKQKSFTLIELLVVIVIIGIFAGVIMISTSSAIDKANIAKIKVFEESVQNNLAANMVSAWDADHVTKTEAGNWTLNDKWGNNHGTFHNGTGIVCSSTSGSEACPQIVNDKQMGNVLSFDGVNDYIDLGNSSSLNITNELTISVWIKPYNVSADYSRIVHKADTSGLLRGYGIAQSSVNGKIVGFYQKNHTTVEFSRRASVILQNGQWYHVAMTWNGVDNDIGISMYVNGINSSENTTGGDHGWGAAGAGVNIGKRVGPQDVYYFNGLIDNVRIYNAALSSSQIKQNYIAGLDSLLSKELISKEEYNARIEALSQK